MKCVLSSWVQTYGPRYAGVCYNTRIMHKRFLIVGNWKMNPLSLGDGESLLHSLSNVARQLMHVTALVCVPDLFLSSLLEKSRNYTNYHVGAQNAVPGDVGPETGSVSVGMMKDLGVTHILVGHSDQRASGDTGEVINKKLKNILEKEMFPILIVGEEERTNSSYLKIIEKQLDEALVKIPKKDLGSIIFAYEPVWSVGAKAKKECTPVECKEAVERIREYLDKRGSKNAGKKATILYGGSSDDKDVRSFLEEGGVDGVLAGRASLDPRMIGLMLKIAEDVAEKQIATEQEEKNQK